MPRKECPICSALVAAGKVKRHMRNVHSITTHSNIIIDEEAIDKGQRTRDKGRGTRDRMRDNTTRRPLATCGPRCHCSTSRELLERKGGRLSLHRTFTNLPSIIF